MKQLLFLLLMSSISGKSFSQQFAGLWYSSDSTRIYKFQEESPGKWNAIIQSSTRKNDSVGFKVIRELIYNKNKKRFEGYMYSVMDDQSAFIKINLDNPEKIRLKLNRMFFFAVKINWYKLKG